jgi:transmembrane sensor
LIARKTNEDIDDVAVAWVAREDRAPLSEEDKQALRVWLDGDPRRPGAYLRAKAVAMRTLSARALGANYDPAGFGGAEGEQRPSRRRIMAWGGAALASAAVVGVAMGLQAPRAYATARGEIRLTPLADGSTMMLNTQTLVRVKYDRDRRFASLDEGEAYFTVLPDPARPFVVEVAGRRFSTTSGAFRIRKLKGEPLDVLVHGGRLDLTSHAPPGAERAVVLEANMRLTARDNTAAVPRRASQDEVRRDLLWREGQIAFEGETLAQAAASFARYSDVRVVVPDPALAREPVVGLFAANDPVGFGHAAAEMFGATAEVRNGAVVLQRGSGEE